MESKGIVFFDGECGLCQRSILFLMRLDKTKKLYFSALSSHKALELLGTDRKLDSVTFYHLGKVYYKTDALMRIVVYLRPALKFIYILRLIPKKVRDYLYDQVAKRRSNYFCSIEIQSDRIIK